MEDKENKVTQDSEIIKEQVKQRPINKRKLIRRTLITVLMAVIFGTVACLTFLLLEPIFSNKLYPEEGPAVIEFEEDETEEILPEDMIADESEMQAENQEPVELEDEQIEKVLEAFKLDITDYITMYQALDEVAKEAQKSIVTVSGVSSDVDWFNDTYESEEQTSGVIIADNDVDFIILVNVRAIEDAEFIRVTFWDGSQYETQIKQEDKSTGFAILSVPKNVLPLLIKEQIKVIPLGNSSSASLQGSPIIALGRPISNADSISYGIVTSTSGQINMVDAKYKIITTDIYGSVNATGILINMRGNIIGFIDNSYNSSDTKNLISAVGISDMKKLIGKMSRGEGFAYLGANAIDVTQQANEELGVPFGAYIIEIELDSPAMDAGIQSGDVIVKINDTDILQSMDFVNTLMESIPEQTVKITLMRQNPEGYSDIYLNVTLGERK